jgi:hypothetical protein
MTLSETKKIVALLQFNYPDTLRDLSDEAYKIYVRQWQAFFADEPYDVVEAAVKAHIVTSTDRFMPNVGQIKEMIRKLTAPEEQELTEQEAWSLVVAATRNGIYGYREEYEKLPYAVQRAVGSAKNLREWAMMDSETVNSVIASNFMRSYRGTSQAEKEWAKLPAGFREEMRKLGGGLFRPLLEEGDENNGEK